MEDEVRKREIENAKRLSALKKLIQEESDIYENLIYRHAYFQVLLIDNKGYKAYSFGLEGILPTCIKIMYRMQSSEEEKRKAYEIYREVLRHCARYNFHCYLLYMEIDREAKARFYEPRMKVLKPVVEALQELRRRETRLSNDKYATRSRKDNSRSIFPNMVLWEISREM